MSGDMATIIHLVLDASLVVQIVLAMLAIASLGSWAIILAKRSVLARASTEANHFEAAFWSGGDLGTLYRNLEAKGGSTGMTSITPGIAFSGSAPSFCSSPMTPMIVRYVPRLR